MKQGVNSEKVKAMKENTTKDIEKSIKRKYNQNLSSSTKDLQVLSIDVWRPIHVLPALHRIPPYTSHQHIGKHRGGAGSARTYTMWENSNKSLEENQPEKQNWMHE